MSSPLTRARVCDCLRALDGGSRCVVVVGPSQSLTLHLLDQPETFNRFADLAHLPVRDPGVDARFLRGRRLHPQTPERPHAEWIGVRKIQGHDHDAGGREAQRDQVGGPCHVPSLWPHPAAQRYMHAIEGRDLEIAKALSILASADDAAKLPRSRRTADVAQVSHEMLHGTTDVPRDLRALSFWTTGFHSRDRPRLTVITPDGP